jgi:hypothetical protein
MAGGTYYNAGCTKKPMPKYQGKYEWFPAFNEEVAEVTLPKPGFTLALKEGTVAVWKDKALKIVCSNVVGTGSVISSKSEEVTTLTFEGCTSGGGFCTSPGETAGTIVRGATTSQLLALGWLSKAEGKVGADLFGSASGFGEDLWEFECSSGKAAALGIKGITDQGISPVVSGKMLGATTLKWKSKPWEIPERGDCQVPEHFEEESGQRCFQVEYFKGTPEYASSDFIGLKMTLVQTYEEPIEINPVV